MSIVDDPGRIRYSRGKITHKRRFPFMTLIVGIVAQDAIVFGADSQTTYENSKILHTNKLHSITFQNTTAIVAESGYVPTAEQVIRKFRKSAAGVVVDCEEDAVAFLELIFESMPQGLAGCTLLVGLFLNGQPVLLRGDSNDGVTLHQNGYLTEGVGDEVSRFVLNQALHDDSAQLSSSVAAAYAIYAVAQASQYSTFVGGRIRVLTLSRITDPKDSTWEHIQDEAMPEHEVESMKAIITEAALGLRPIIQERLESRFRAFMAGLFRKGSDEL